MSVYPGPNPVPCPCDACDEFAGSPDTYCITCEHHGCRGNTCQCPPAERSPNFCDVCNEQKETVKAHPDTDANRICGDCHSSGGLPDEEEWWDEDSVESTVDSNKDKCYQCGDEYGLSRTASCSTCGFIPEEHRLKPE